MVELRSDCNAEASFLAALYRAIVFGGEITVNVRKDDSPVVIEFDGINSSASTKDIA